MPPPVPTVSPAPERRIAGLPCWPAPPEAIVPLAGGITNTNFRVRAGGREYVVRLGGDIPANHVMRFNEQAASRAAGALGISPAVVHCEPDALVIDFVVARTFKPDEVAGDLERIVALMHRVHREMAGAVRGPMLSYWLFHVIQDNLHTLRARGVDNSLGADLDALAAHGRALEQALGPTPVTLCHNDWLAANVLDDGRRLWLIDWDYAGFNSPLSDLGSLASNNQFDEALERRLLALYDGREPDAARWRAYLAMKAASLLKETLWSMTSEGLSTIAFDYAAYSRTNLERFGRAWAQFQDA